MTELVTLLTTYYPQLIPIVLLAIVIGYVIGQFFAFVDLQIKVLKREEIKEKLKLDKFEEKQKEYQKAFDECGFTPGNHGLYGETYDILKELKHLRNAVKNKSIDAKEHYFWSEFTNAHEYRFLFHKRFKKWKDNFIIDRKIVSEIKNLEKLIDKQELNVQKTDEKRKGCISSPSLIIEHIDFTNEKDRKKLLSVIDSLETKLKVIKIKFNLDTHGTIPKQL